MEPNKLFSPDSTGTRRKPIFLIATAVAFLISAIAFAEPGTIELPATVPERIVSLSPAATEILCAVGAENQLIARTDYCDYPPEVRKIPSVGGFDAKTLSLEKILSFRPDFVYMTKGMHDHLVSPLRKYGIYTYVSDAESISGIYKEITDIGAITGHPEKAGDICADMRKTFSSIKTALDSEKSVSVYWEVWNSPYMSVGGISFLNEVIETAGGKNIFTDIKQTYPLVNEESIIMRNPDVIVITKTGSITAETVKKRNGWQEMSAVKNDRIITMDADIASRPGPRIVQAVIDLAISLHPDNDALKQLFKNKD